MKRNQKWLYLLPAFAALAVLVPPTAARADIESDILELMVAANAELEAMGSDLRLEVVEYYTAEDEQGRTVFFSNVGNKQLAFDFVPGDPRRVPWSGPVGPGDDITFASDGSFLEGAALPSGLVATQGAISSAMATWQGVNCSNIPLSVVLTGGANIGFLQFLLDGSGSPVIAADIVHAGFGTIVDLVFLPPPVIAAAFTFFFSPGTDIDNNGKIDAALREIYYTRNFPWETSGANIDIDVETVALHEAGHGLSQGHFGKLFRTDKNGKFHFAPRAVMNAGYTGIQSSVARNDKGGHCSNWASWPNN